MFHCTNVDLRIFTSVCSANPSKIHMQTRWQHFGPYLYSAAFIVDGKSGIINHSRDISGFEVTRVISSHKHSLNLVFATNRSK